MADVLFCRFDSELTGFEMALLMNTGAEAVESAVKLARKWAYKVRYKSWGCLRLRADLLVSQVKGVPQDQAIVLSAEDNFHGRTYGTSQVDL